MAYELKKDRKALFRANLEFVLATGQKKYVLGSSQQLNKPSIRLYAIYALRNDEGDFSPTGNDVASLATYQQAFITLQDPGSNNIIQQEQLAFYIPNTEVKPTREFHGQQIDFTKSYFEFPSTYDLSSDNAKSLMLTIEYLDLEA